MAITKVTADVMDLTRVEPTGVVHLYAGDSEPEGYLFCNGQEILRSEYSDLFDVIGETYGEGDGSTTFLVPDFRAMFPRGAKMGATGQIEVNSIGYTPQELATRQSDAAQGHRHRLESQEGSGPGGPADSNIYFGTSTTGQIYYTEGPIADLSGNGTPRTGSETRPINLSVNFIIKY